MARPEQVFFGWMHGRQFVLTRNYGELHPKWAPFKKGSTVKAVMVSRMGDVGITLNLASDIGYDLRVEPWELEPIGPIPDDICKLCFCILTGHDHADCSRDRKCEKCGGKTGPCDPTCAACRLDEWRAGRES